MYIVHAKVTKKKFSFRKTSACRDRTLKKPTNLDGNNTSTVSPHPYILCQFAATYTYQTCFVFVSCAQRVVEGKWDGQWWVCSACWCAWGVSYVVGGCNVVAILSMSCLYAETVECISSARSAEHGRYGLSFMCKTVEWAMLSTLFIQCVQIG